MTQTVADALETTARSSPYQGLMHFTAGDAAYFFGRERDRKLIAANLIVSRVAIAYGPSGVGKSSLLRAGVQHDLNELAKEAFAAGKQVEHVVAVFNGPWQGDVVRGIDDAVRDAVSQVYGILPQPRSELPPFDELLAEWTKDLDAQLLLILDQFEEFFLYVDSEAGRRFEAELPVAMTRPDLDVDFLISIREDGLAGLDRFKARVTTLFDTSLRVDHLDRKSAAAAIEEPVKHWNDEFRKGLPPVRVELDLIEAVLDQVRTGQVVVGKQGRGGSGAGDRIETPHLQLVMERLWEAESLDGDDPALRLETLDRLGGAEQIVLTRGREAIDRLADVEQQRLAAIFDRLVTPSGAKIAHALDDLAKWAGATPEELQPTLETLCNGEFRVLRPVSPPPGARGGMRYELFHDVLGRAVLDWQARYEHEQSERKLAEQVAKEAEERALAEEQARRDRTLATRAFRFAVAAAVTALLAIGVGIGAVFLYLDANKAKQHANEATSRAGAEELAASAQAGLAPSSPTALVAGFPPNPHVSLLLARRAAQTRTPWTESALREAVAEDRVLAVVPGKRGRVTDAALSPDGTKLFVKTQDAVDVYDTKTVRLLQTTAGSDRVVVATQLTGPHPVALTKGKDGLVMWHLGQSPAPQRSLPQTHPSHSVFSRDGRTLATIARGVVHIVDTRTGKTTRTFPVHGAYPQSFFEDYERIALSRSGRYLLVAPVSAFEARFETNVWDTRTGRRVSSALDRYTQRAIGPYAHTIAFSPNATRVALGGYSGGVVWDWRHGSTWRFALRSGVNGLAFNPGGTRILVWGGDSTARIYSAATARLLTSLTGHLRTLDGAAWSGDGSMVATTSDDGTARIWEPESGEAIATLRGHLGAVSTAAFDARRSRLVTGGDDGTTRVWDAQPRALALDVKSQVDSVAVSPDGKRVLTGSDDGNAIVWQAATGRRLRAKVDDPEYPGSVYAVAYSPDNHSFASVGDFSVVVFRPRGRYSASLGDHYGADVEFDPTGHLIVVASDGGIDVRKVAKGLPMVQRLVPEADVASARFSPDGRRVLLTTGWSARVYDIKTRKQLWKVRRPGGFAEAVYSPDGTRILTAGNSPYARVWSARTGKVLLTLGGHKRPVTSASYSPDGSLIVTTSDDWTARVWDAHTGTQRGVLAGPLDAVTSAAFAPGGQAVVTGSVDGTAHIYPASAFAPLVEIRRRANQQARVPLTRFERTELDALTSGR